MEVSSKQCRSSGRERKSASAGMVLSQDRNCCMPENAIYTQQIFMRDGSLDPALSVVQRNAASSGVILALLGLMVCSTSLSHFYLP